MTHAHTSPLKQHLHCFFPRHLQRHGRLAELVDLSCQRHILSLGAATLTGPKLKAPGCLYSGQRCDFVDIAHFLKHEEGCDLAVDGFSACCACGVGTRCSPQRRCASSVLQYGLASGQSVVVRNAYLRMRPTCTLRDRCEPLSAKLLLG